VVPGETVECCAIVHRIAVCGAGIGSTAHAFAPDSPLEGDGFELPVPGRIYSAAMRSQVISRCSSLFGVD
jgi:hypothetical protein